MMVTPGCIYTSDGLIEAEVAANPTPDHFYGGFGFSATGQLCIATGTPAGSSYNRGFRMSSRGAIYGATNASPDFECEGYLFDSSNGKLYISNGSSAPARFNNGDGFSSSGRLGLHY